VNSHVKRVLFVNKRASGVEYIPNGNTDPSASPRTIQARKLVVVSSGALGTPSILERSGVGRAEVLKKVGIPVVADVPGVGENYQDHHLMIYPYLSNLTQRETIDAIVNGQFDVGQLIQTNDPILGWNSMDIQAKVRPTDPEVDELGPEFHNMWNKEYKNAANRPLAMFSLVNA
jgi:alcohol oxidase